MLLFHDDLDIAQLQLVIDIELLDDGAVLLPVIGAAGTKEGCGRSGGNGRGGSGGRKCRGRRRRGRGRMMMMRTRVGGGGGGGSMVHGSGGRRRDGTIHHE